MYDFSFLKGSIETIILNALYSGDKYGYEIAREIKEKTENKYEIKQPTLYGYLKRLEQNNLISSYWGGGDSNGGRRRYYKLTDSGKNVCLDYMSEWNFQRDIIDSLVAQTDDDELRKISQSEATSILGTKTKRSYRKREIVSNTDLEELNKQLDLIKQANNSEDDTSLQYNEQDLNTEPQNQEVDQVVISENIIKTISDIAPTEEKSFDNNEDTTIATSTRENQEEKQEQYQKQETISDSYKNLNVNVSIYSSYPINNDPNYPLKEVTSSYSINEDKPSTPVISTSSFTINQPNIYSTTNTYSNSLTNDKPNDFAKKEEIIEEEPETPSINEQLRNTAPAGPQLIFAPTPPSNANTEEKPVEPTPATQPKQQINNSPIITNSVFFASSAATASPTLQEPKQQPLKQTSKTESTDEKQYKQILGNLLEDQLDEMSKAKFSSTEKYDNAINKSAFDNLDSSAPVPLKNAIKTLEKDGVKAMAYSNSNAKTYMPTPMIFKNKIKCYVSCLLAFSMIIELILMFVIFKSAVPDLKFTIFIILILLACLPAIGFTVNYIMNPTKKAEKRFNFKFNFINSWIFVGSVLAIISIIYFVIIGAGDTKQLLLDFVLPFILSLNAPLGVTYHNLILNLP